MSRNLNKIVSYLGLGHPDGSGLLLVDQIHQLVVPVVLSQIQGHREHMTPKLLQLLTLLQQLFRGQMSFSEKDIKTIVTSLVIPSQRLINKKRQFCW